jgi:hypothetical protein
MTIELTSILFPVKRTNVNFMLLLYQSVGCPGRTALHGNIVRPALEITHGGRPIYFVAAILVVLSGLFYLAGQHQLGSLSTEVCQYGSTFCDNPVYVLAGAGLAAVWGMFVSVR